MMKYDEMGSRLIVKSCSQNTIHLYHNNRNKISILTKRSKCFLLFNTFGEKNLRYNTEVYFLKNFFFYLTFFLKCVRFFFFFILFSLVFLNQKTMII